MRRWHRILLAGLLVTGVLVMPHAGGAQEGDAEPGTCTEPYGPVASLGMYERVDADIDWSAATRLDSTQTLDDSGSQIVAPQVDTTLVVADTPAGELRLADGGRDIYGVSAGDLDGDGVGEIWVFATDLSRSFIVPSGTAAGDHEVATVGVQVPPGVPVGVAERWLGGLVVVEPTDPGFTEGNGVVLPPADLIAPGPGGDATGVTPIAEFPGVPRAIAAFDEPQLLVTWSDGLALRVRSYSEDGSSVDFTTASTGSSGELAGVPVFSSGEGPGGRYLMASESGRNPLRYVWSYDDPCATLQQQAEPPAEAPAPVEPQPIEFTG